MGQVKDPDARQSGRAGWYMLLHLRFSCQVSIVVQRLGRVPGEDSSASPGLRVGHDVDERRPAAGYRVGKGTIEALGVLDVLRVRPDRAEHQVVPGETEVTARLLTAACLRRRARGPAAVVGDDADNR